MHSWSADLGGLLADLGLSARTESGSVTYLVWQGGPRPVAPCDPASGSRTGGALRRLGGRALETDGLG